MYYYRRQIKFVITLLLLAGLLYGGIKGWMYHNTKQAIDELSLAMAGRAEIQYEGIDSELAGAVRVRGITLLPTGAPQPIRIGQVRVSGPELPFFLWGEGGKQQPPKRLRVDLVDMRVDLDPALFAALQEEMSLPGQAPSKGCGPTEDLDPELLRELGFSELLMDASFSYDYDERDRRLDAEMEFIVHQMQRLQASFALGDVDPDAMQGSMNSLPTLAGVALEMRVEPEFGNRYLAACAKRAGKDLESYRKVLIADSLASLSRAGMQLGSGLTQALEEFHLRWGDLRISAEPPTPVNPMALMFSPPENWQRQLGIRVKLNQVEVPDLRFELRPPDAAELAVLLGQEPPPAKPTKPQDRYRYVYHDVPVGALPQHIGAEVRLHMNNDQPMRSGTLVSVQASEARVEQRLHGGKMSAHVPLQEIGRVEVRKVEKIPTSK